MSELDDLRDRLAEADTEDIGEPDDDIDLDDDDAIDESDGHVLSLVGDFTDEELDEDDGAFTEAELDDLVAKFTAKMKDLITQEFLARGELSIIRESNARLIGICVDGLSRLVSPDPMKAIGGDNDSYKMQSLPSGSFRKVRRLINDLADTARLTLVAERKAVEGSN